MPASQSHPDAPPRPIAGDPETRGRGAGTRGGDAARQAGGGRGGVEASAGLFVAALLAFVAIGAALPVLPGFVRGPLHSGDVSVGVVVGAFALTSVFCRPLAGRQADGRGRRVVLVADRSRWRSAERSTCSPAACRSLILARLAVGAGEGAVYTAGAIWAVDLAPADRQGLALGLFGLAVWGGLSLGPIAGELLRSAVGYDAVWVLTALLPLAGAAIALRLPEPPAPAGVRDPGPLSWLSARRAPARASRWRSPTSATRPWRGSCAAPSRARASAAAQACSRPSPWRCSPAGSRSAACPTAQERERRRRPPA